MGAKFGDKTECKNGCPDQLAAKAEDQKGPIIRVLKRTQSAVLQTVKFRAAALTCRI